MKTTLPELDKTYTPAAVEPQVISQWREADAFHAEPSDPGEPYVIVIPPPNVTAALHMGHALNNTLQDVLIRFRRMQGRNAIWMPGTDHAGIATQTIVEKRVLQEEGKRRTDFQREEFVGRIQAWKDEYEARITEQLKAMGCSCDWDRQRFTMDAVCAAAVREAFYRLFADGLIYRGKRLVNWDPVTQTALADDEVEMHTVHGHFWYMKYPVVKPGGEAAAQGGAAADDPTAWVETGEFCTVATTRPETMLGDTAVAVNPDDPERARFIGSFVKLPICNRVIPVVGDDYVVKPDPESSDEKARFASGFLKVTPAHDPNDYEIGRRHELPLINVMAPDGSISTANGWPAEDAAHADAFLAELTGKDRFEARKMIVSWFEARGLLAEVRDYSHNVGHSYRSHVPVEPYLSDQWYVKVTDDRLAGAALRAMAAEQRSASEGCVWRQGGSFEGAGAAAGSDAAFEGAGELRFYPSRYARTFQLWHENIRDWCISRQLWWGHRIPVWTADLPLDDTVAASPMDRGPDAQVCAAIDKAVGGRLAELFAQRFPQVKHHLTASREGAEPGFVRVSICLRDDDAACVQWLESCGFVQDPDVLDTWFSSALWPISTMGWPDPAAFADATPDGSPTVSGGDAVLSKWNPGHVLCTAREIITLWVSRMVMFNVYFRHCLPFRDVFIHAMIQDGEGQKMSKSLGNGVDPLDIIHSHGADAMRFTLASMTTQTQDVRMPVDVVCPHTGEAFTPKMTTTHGGYRVAAPVQDSPSAQGRQMVTSFGLASGKASPTDDIPLARNTSSKFDFGRNFANKLWNAVRFAMGHLEAAPKAEADAASLSQVQASSLSPADRWILSRLARTIAQTTGSLERFEFNVYADALYDFIWRDLCDWYIEAVKPTVREADHAAQRQVLASCIDAALRLLHPVMPFVTEKLWSRLAAVWPGRGVDGLALPDDATCVKAAWPAAEASLIDDAVEADFAWMQEIVGAIRQVRTQYKVPPRQQVDASLQLGAEGMSRLTQVSALVQSLANVKLVNTGEAITKPEDAATAASGGATIYLHGLIDAGAEIERIDKRIAELAKSIKALEGRLNNKGYTEKAPAHLVEQTREQLAQQQAERQTLQSEREKLG